MLDKKTRDAREAPVDALPGRRRRADRAIETRRKLLDAAAKVVGAEGYANASVAKVTALAEIAQGTFYNYFASQQDLFDQLLPELGTELLDFIRTRIAGESDSFKREEIGFRAFFDFLAERPEFYRILNEAETFAPKAYHDHMRNMSDGYLRALTRSHAKGELPGFDRRELEVLVYSLLAARNYLSYRYLFRDGRSRRLPPWVDGAYMKLVTGGMMHGGTTGRTHRPRRSQPASPGAPLSDIPRFRLAPSKPGETHVEFDLTDECRDPSGQVRRAIILELIEASATMAASEMSEYPLELQSLATAFPCPAEGDGLSAVASPRTSGNTIHVGIEIHELTGNARLVATAQAVYSIDAGNERQHES
jgi:AcrR family transcriptional regulator/acyl-coenzyme A thioesterase PaaI-like protein